MKQKTQALAQVAISPGRGASRSRPRSPGRRTRRRRWRSPARTTSISSTSSPAWNWKSMASRTSWPLMAITRSPATRPAAAAGDRSRTAATTTPSAGPGAARPGKPAARRALGGAGGRRPEPPISADEQVFTGVLAGGVGGVEVAHAVHEVLQTGDDGEGGGQPGDGVEGEGAGPRRRPDVALEHAGEHGEDLEERGGLAGARGPRMDAPAEHVDEQGPHHEDDVAADHHDGDPRGEHAELREGHERGGEQELVCGGIEKGPETALTAPAAGHIAIEHVREGGQREDQESYAGPAVDEQEHEDRNEEDAEEGQPVRQSHRACQCTTRVGGRRSRGGSPTPHTR